MGDKPSVSVIMPLLNVGPYIRQCIESVVSQTLRDIEIICVDAGSTDETLPILEEYAARDSRITILHSDRKSYGYQMNLGFDAAKGEYIGIIETNGHAEPDMFERLCATAKADALDAVKSGFFYYYSREDRNDPCPVASQVMCGRVFCPLTDFRSQVEQADFFNIKPTIGSGIYRRDFIRHEGIRFNETPGTSSQNISFAFKVWALAKRVRLVPECYLHDRQDDESSSIHSPDKIYCVCDEYDEIQRFLDSRPELKGRLEPIMCRLRYDAYMWNYEHLADELKPEFVQRMQKDFLADMKDGKCVQKLYPRYRWNTMHLVMDDPAEFHAWHSDEKAGIPHKKDPFATETFPRKLRRKLIGGYRCLREQGVRYTWNNLKEKIRRREL